MLAFKTVFSPAVTFPNFMRVENIKEKKGGEVELNNIPVIKSAECYIH